MTTKEYIQLVDRVVGTKGSLKVPAYWMNRLMKESTKMVEDVVKNIDLSKYPTWDQADENYAFRYEFNNLNNYVYNTLAGKVSTINTKVDTIISTAKPSFGGIYGPSLINKRTIFTINYSDRGIIGSYTVTWTVPSYLTIVEQTDEKLIVDLGPNVNDVFTGTIGCEWKNGLGNTGSTSKSITIAPYNVIITSTTNAPIQAALYEAGLVSNKNYSLKSEVEIITEEQLQPGDSYETSIFYTHRTDITNFDEFIYFTGLTSIPDHLFSKLTKLKRIYLPRTITTFNHNVFEDCTSLNTIYLPKSITSTVGWGNRGNVKIKNIYMDSWEWWLSQGYDVNQDYAVENSTRNFYLASFDENDNLNVSIQYDVVIPDSITSIRSGAFAASSIRKVWFHKNVTEIKSRSFIWTTSLELIDGEFGTITVDTYAFYETNNNVKLGKNVPFALIKGENIYLDQNCTIPLWGLTRAPIAVPFVEDARFYTKDPYKFYNKLTTGFTDIRYTGSVQDISSLIGYKYVTITSNIDSTFNVNWNNITQGIYSFGDTVLLPLTTTVGIILPTEDYTPSGTTISTREILENSVINLTYKEKADLYIQHIDGNLYTSEEWTAGGYSNDNANGVAVVRPFSGSFVIAKENVSSSTLRWGGYNKTITDIVTTTTYDNAIKDNAGISNTRKIISQLSGYTDNYSVKGAPAAEACTNYTFPNGSTGYLGAVGEWNTAYSQFASITALMNQIGSAMTYGYWTSTQQESVSSWIFNWKSNGYASWANKQLSKYVRAFSAPLSLSINCNNIDVEFQVTYTKFRNGGEKTVTLKSGIHNTIIPQSNTTVTISVASGYEWAEIDVTTQSFTYIGSPITATFVAGVESGVYIQHTNGTLYTTTEWTDGGYNNNVANGVTVIDSGYAFTIAKEDAGTSLEWGGYNKTITDIVKSTSSSTALLDFDGEGNTTKIIEQLTGYTDSKGITGAPAAEACVNYTFPNGNKGYLPSLGEWNIAYNNKAAIVEAMSLIGGTEITSNDYWTSTQSSNLYGWGLRWSNGGLYEYNKYRTIYVRAFSSYNF